jgi:hypothetical protein
MDETLTTLIMLAGVGQLGVLVASALERASHFCSDRL